MKLLSVRMVNFLAFLVCAGLLGAAIYFEVVDKLDPCPLCILQRLIFILLGFLFLIGMIKFPPQGHRYFHYGIAAVALLGVFTAARQIWIEHLPPYEIPTCGANLKYLFQVLPFKQALQLVIQGTGSCAKVTWRLFGFSMASYALVFFIGLTGVAVWQALRPSH